jgi:vacuolar-type H+-ATPase subunit I/STV1
MGNLVWHEYSRFVSITASIYAVWSAFFGLFYRKFFWDFIGGTLRDPGGLQPSKNAAPFIAVIVKAPVIQILAMILGMFIIAMEFPIPPLRNLAIHRSLVLRIVLLLFQTFLTLLYYQGTNAAIWSLIAAMCYGRAEMLGEKMAEAKDNRVKGGRA